MISFREEEHVQLGVTAHVLESFITNVALKGAGPTLQFFVFLSFFLVNMQGYFKNVW